MPAIVERYFPASIGAQSIAPYPASSSDAPSLPPRPAYSLLIRRHLLLLSRVDGRDLSQGSGPSLSPWVIFILVAVIVGAVVILCIAIWWTYRIIKRPRRADLVPYEEPAIDDPKTRQLVEESIPLSPRVPTASPTSDVEEDSERTTPISSQPPLQLPQPRPQTLSPQSTPLSHPSELAASQRPLIGGPRPPRLKTPTPSTDNHRHLYSPIAQQHSLR